MRRRLQKFLPILLIALMLQVLAPIGACWAAAIAASDPLASAFICHDSAAAYGQRGDQSGDHRTHDGACAICCAVQASASIDPPQLTAFAVPDRQTARVWKIAAQNLSPTRPGSNTQARAPPSSM